MHRFRVLFLLALLTPLTWGCASTTSPDQDVRWSEGSWRYWQHSPSGGTWWSLSYDEGLLFVRLEAYALYDGVGVLVNHRVPVEDQYVSVTYRAVARRHEGRIVLASYSWEPVEHPETLALAAEAVRELRHRRKLWKDLHPYLEVMLPLNGRKRHPPS